MVPEAPLPPAVKVTPGVGLGGVMSPGADGLQLVIFNDHVPGVHLFMVDGKLHG